MEPVAERLLMYGLPSDAEPLSWAWVQSQLVAAGTYWVVAGGTDRPHPRPVWGIWQDDRLHLSVGSKVLARQLPVGAAATVHLDSGTDVVIVEATAAGPTSSPELVERYGSKYRWDYEVDRYGPLTSLVPSTVIAWRSGGWAGRDGFRATGRWRLAPPQPQTSNERGQGK